MNSLILEKKISKADAGKVQRSLRNCGTIDQVDQEISAVTAKRKSQI